MKTHDFYYELPPELIAQTPISQRDQSRLMVCHRDGGRVEHRTFRDIVEYIRPGDALVLNETRVIPARLTGRREDTGGAIEFLLLRRLSGLRWEVLAGPARRAAPGRRFLFGGGLEATVAERLPEGRRIVDFTCDGVFEEVLDRVGAMPLPPYIHEKLADRERYQTVYARESGSAAAPTAGLHFTPDLLDTISRRGALLEKVTLHVGLGTFRPVKTETVEEHMMHAEYCRLDADTARRLNAARERGGRIVCVGTTSVRTLESAADADGRLAAFDGMTDIFIYPGYRFRAADALVTNFHLPESTLLMMVSALAGRERILDVYREAVERRYRFFSFGDAMLIL
ncbi:MAG: tRNA preQ1(34) S-adenosylmethionine ribosyltransferase-isomerase QueA [Clostridiales bacterium]|nr:tRNA preQ1(34) S-adenosylmethionine ribosyltransferase-isomerase QueA [Clostridiales bacterium]